MYTFKRDGWMEGYLTRAGGWMEKLTDTQSKKASSHSTEYLQNTTSHSFFSLATTKELSY